MRVWTSWMLVLGLLVGCEDLERPASSGGAAGVAGSTAAGQGGGAGQAGAGGAKAGQGGAAGVSGSSGQSGAGAGGLGGAGGAAAGAGGSTAGGPAGQAGSGECGEDPVLPAEMLTGGKDPTGGMFTLEQALAGLPEGPGPLRAILTTDVGELTCVLEPALVPMGVANFVGLARGTRPFRLAGQGKWQKGRFYDGLTFHRVIPGFVAQGGDPQGTGIGGPGYSFADEITTLKHVPGALAYANSGADTNGSQFYITETEQPELDGGYTVFGVCTPVSVVMALTGVPRDDNDRPLTPLKLQSVKITRCAP